MSFHNESYSLHDFPKRGHDTILFAGDVIRVFDGPFGDAVILGFSDEGECRLSRPYVYASGVGTTGPTPLLGAETYSMWPSRLRVALQVHPILQRDKKL